MVRRISSIFLMLALAVFVSISCKKKDDDDDPIASSPAVVVSSPGGEGGTSGDPVDEKIIAPVAIPVAIPVGERPTTDKTTITEPLSYPLVRITPEQLSRKIKDTLGFDAYFYVKEGGREFNYLESLFGTALGGIDFQTVSRRDPSTKAQTLLITRTLSWFIARYIPLGDSSKPANEQVFSDCDEWVDRPFMPADAAASTADQNEIKEGEVRWAKCVDTIFWRLYARPPSDTEKSAVKAAFIKAVENEPDYPATTTNVPFAWALVLYSMMSSMEFWHI